jgi:hypothetical protein
MMKLFICWAGDISIQIAAFLHEWLPAVHHNIKPFMSAQDIGKGERWPKSLASELGDLNFGIVCLTSDNLTAPWLHFEAGALSKLGKARAIPILFQLKTGDISGPLSEFQAAVLDNKEDMRLALRSINESMGGEGNPNWERTFDGLWYRVEGKIKSILDQNKIQILSLIDGGILQDAQISGKSGFTYLARGTLKFKPKDHSIWLLHGAGEQQWPQGTAEYDPVSAIWEGRTYLQTWISGTFINAVVAPPTSQQFFEYYQRYGNAKPLSGIPKECENIATVWARNPKYSPTTAA